MKLYYCNIDNFGDALNKYIFEKVFDCKIEFCDTVNADAIGIGSILERALFQIKDLPFIFNLLTPPCSLKVFSSGFGFEDNHYKKKPRFFKTMIFKRRMEFISLRGELTKKSCENILKKELNNVVLGDLGLLASELLDKKDFKKKYDIGFCPHYADYNHPIFKELLDKNPNSILLNTKSDPIEFLEKLNSCQTIVSTGLHPLIAADSLGIPNIWARISETSTSRYKYADYYSIYGLNPQPYDLLNNSIDADFVIKNYKVDSSKVDKIKETLLKTHREYFKNL